MGERIAGKYRVHHVFEGGLGRAYVVSEAGGDPFILKAPKPDADNDQFLQEAQKWIGLGRHANIVPAFWAERLAGMPCVAAEFIPPDAEGRTSLRDHLRMTRPSLKQTLRWGAQFCDAFEHAHCRGLTAHRDVKPENILISRSGDLQLTDFGISVVGRPLQSEKNQIVGTPPYMSPEQWTGDTQDFRTDAYAFGLVLYEICFGGLPWRARSVTDLRAECLSTLSFQTPPNHPLSFVIGPMTVRDVEDRIPTPALLRLLFSMAATAASTTLPPPAAPIDDEREELLAQSSLSLAGDWDKAFAAAKRLTQDWPSFAPGWTQLGRLLLEEGRLREAGLATQRAIDLDPTRSAPWNNLGIVLHRAGHHERAVHSLQTALECDPGNTGAMSNIAGPLVQLGRAQEAIAYLEEAAKLAPDKLAVWINLGSLLYAHAQLSRAAECFNSALGCVGPNERTGVIEQIRRVAPEFTPVHQS